MAILLVLAICAISITCSFSLGLKSPAIHQLSLPIDHTESPSWDTRNNVLYYVNIQAGEIYRYDYTNKTMTSIRLDGWVAPVIPSKKDPNLLIVGLNRSIVAVEWKGQSTNFKARTLTTVSKQFPTSVLNDGKADKNGRLWIGTKGNDAGPGAPKLNEGVLYKVTCNNLESPEVVIAPVNISNGMAWNRANNKFYYIDTPTGKVMEYKYDNTKGAISNPRVVFDVSKYDQLTGLPDGVTIDKDDNIWVALIGGGSVVKVDPKPEGGKLLQIVALPAQYVTSAIWGGPNLDILLVTTSRLELTKKQRQEQPAAGSVFAVVGLGTAGLPLYGVDLLDNINDETCKRTPEKDFPA